MNIIINIKYKEIKWTDKAHFLCSYGTTVARMK